MPPVPENIPFLFTISGITTPESGRESGRLSVDFENYITNKFKNRKFDSFVPDILIQPIIVDERVVRAIKNFIYYRKIINEIKVGVNIDYNKWISSSREGRIILFSENLKESINNISSNIVSNEIKRMLIECIDEAAERMV